MAEDKDQFVDRVDKLGEGEFRRGAKIIPDEIPTDYIPPSASMNPAASAQSTTDAPPTDGPSAD